MKLLKHHFTWVHIGSGNKEIETSIKESCAKEQIQFEFLGHMTRHEINEYLNSNPMAYFANTSTWEGVPVSMMEAGVFGIPFIATDIPGNLEIVSENNGFIIPLTGDLNEIALKICKCFEDVNLWKEKAANAQDTITSQYNSALNHKVFFEAIKITS
jgi:glycosyltransferase involved in cell wall biosynthesis